MQVLEDDDTDGLLDYGKLVNSCCKTMRDGKTLADSMGLSANDVVIEGAMTFTDKRDGKLYRISVAEAEENEGDEE